MSLFGGEKKPFPGQVPKPQSKPGGLFGKEKGYKSWQQLRQFAREAPFKPLPGTIHQLGKEERVNLIKELEERVKRTGQTYGLSEKTYRERIRPQITKELYELHSQGKTAEKELLKKKMRQWEEWAKEA